MGVKIVMTADYPDYKAGENLEVSEARAERWVHTLEIARYADKRRARAPEPVPARDGE